jgi:hypothetical protein
MMLPAYEEHIRPGKADVKLRLSELPDKIDNTILHIQLWQTKNERRNRV